MNISEIGLSVITPCYNDHTALNTTLHSLVNELFEYDQLVIVDSSDGKDEVYKVVSSVGISCEVLIIWMPPAGVYGAINTGIMQANRPWIQILNSGDMLLHGARKQIDLELSKHPSILLHVFRQSAGSSNTTAYIFTPTESTVWPHQSIIVNRQIHDYFGLYDVNFKNVSDQLFFSKARKKFKYKLHRFILTYYDLTGISSKISFKASIESYICWRQLGNGIFISFVKSFILPIIRVIVGKEISNFLKRYFFSHYKSV